MCKYRYSNGSNLCVFFRANIQTSFWSNFDSPIGVTLPLYLFSHELLSLHVLLLLLLLFQDLLMLLLLLFQCCHRRRLAAHVRSVTVVTCQGTGPRLGRHTVVTGRGCHTVGRARAMWRSRICVLVLVGNIRFLKKDVVIIVSSRRSCFQRGAVQMYMKLPKHSEKH